MRDWLSHRVATTPEATALVSVATGEAWDYAELDAAVEETTGRLAALGLGPGDHLGVVLSTRVESVRLVHATMRLGATLVPLNHQLTAPELDERIARVDLSAIVCGEDTEAQVVEAADDLPIASVDDPAWERVHSLAETDVVPFEPATLTRDDPLLLLFTSGTTGTPKAVVLHLGNVLSNAVASVFRLGILPDDRWLVPLSMHHMGGIGPVLRGPLYGTTVILRDSFEAGPTADDIDKYDATGVSLVPTMLRRMLDARGTLSDSLRIVLLGGAPARQELIERCRAYSIPVYPTYGMTETASQIATATPDEAFEHPGTVGRPLFWVDLSVVDEDGEELPPGETGEFVVSGPTVSPGYYGDPDATRRAFGPHGLRTGDVGYRDESGYVYVLNRTDDRIVTGGENVDPGEVVDVLRSHPDVEEAAVVGVSDQEWGERVSALIVLAPTEDGEEPTAETIVSFCRERLAGFKLPRTIGFADELPRTTSGTVEREVVRAQLQSIRDAERVEIPDAEHDRAGHDGDLDESRDVSERKWRDEDAGSRRVIVDPDDLDADDSSDEDSEHGANDRDDRTGVDGPDDRDPSADADEPDAADRSPGDVDGSREASLADEGAPGGSDASDESGGFDFDRETHPADDPPSPTSSESDTESPGADASEGDDDSDDDRS